uniref:Sodium channel regulatory subunit beta-3 n=1 Tax=Knipowitschia caucasica TaxID=637954 RepID=A0AAV2J1Z8_KNICA
MSLELVCSTGHYCKEGSFKEFPCPLGSYQLRQGQGSCDPCPAGFFCPDQGTYGNTSGLTEETQCLLCDPGMFCKGTGRVDPSGPCAEGFVCINGASEPSPLDGLTGKPCPPGFYCTVGTSVPRPCPKGTYSNKGGLVAVSQCKSCIPGFYCSEPGLSVVSGPCLPGFYCLEGSSTATPKSVLFGDVCPEGHYCLEGSSVPMACPPGSYQNLTGGASQEDCKPCPTGQFQDLSGQKDCNPCLPGFHCQVIGPSPSQWNSNGVSVPEPCPAGYTCPRESLDRQPVPCPKGTYSNNLGLTILGECLKCPPGQFCGSDGLIEPSGPCDSGYLCLSGATVPNPIDNRTGSLCPQGYFCIQGLRAGDCLAGFFCDWGSSKGDEALCPVGCFCPRGTTAPIPCPPGTFSSATGNTHQVNCSTCLVGYYCPDAGTVKPSLCPAGHYCPPGLTLGTEFPCPPGTVQRKLGASSSNDCIACPPGLFCAGYGLSKPSGLCDPGYFCPSGSISSNSSDLQDNSTENHICPVGHFCPPGTGLPHPCPAGSLSLSHGVSRVDGCHPCPQGLFCDRPALADILDAQPCHAGFVCLGGSYSPNPSDGSHGYICPVGHQCPLGSATELPCEPGTYSASPGAAQCLVCPNGTACSSFATREPTVCPAGHFCPAGTALPQPCTLGTFSNQTGAHSISVCIACPSGSYCSSYGASAPSGPCLDGYFCKSGATEPAPQRSDSSSGQCPVGHYCPVGCSSPVPCPLGSMRSTTEGASIESCSACPAGYYCSSEGLSRPSGPCAAGFYCPFDFSSTTPFAFLCPKGHYCPEGSPLPLPCPTGEYQPNVGSDNCVPCRPGFYCEEAIVGEPWLCPPHSFCPAGTMVPQPCPNGTYTYSNQTGLQEEQECLPCPPGKYCRAGKIQGVCAAGYLCLSGSAEFTPQGSNLTQCEWGLQCAVKCPPGYYCPEGTKEAKSCPANTIRSTAGGASQHDCLPCPPQYWCKSGDPTLHLCPAGHYCDGLPGSDYNGGAGPRPCPLHSYRPSPGAGSKGDCLPCPAGSHCNSTGLTDYSMKLCPPGYWCSGFGPPILCPAGTKRSIPGGAAPAHCEFCAGGTFCPDPRSTGVPNVEGSVVEKVCRAGSYCGPQTAEPQICPAGYFCPVGSQSYNTPKQLCLFPYYCPTNSTGLTTCKGGSMPVNTSGLRGSQSSCCTLCEGGTYRPYLSRSLTCLPCPPGYFCPQGTESYKAHPCPGGYVCPVGSSQPIACPPGFFGKLTHAVNDSDCRVCPAGTFNHLEGQKACFPCGSSSTSSPGSSLCTCIGKNRAFQPSDGSCLCRTGFIYYDEQDFRSSSSDSVFDCQPEVNRRCAKGEVRVAASRACVSPTLHSCNVSCGPFGGTLDVEMGICQCERYVSAEELCNTSCLSRLPDLSAQLTSDGQLLLKVKERKGSDWTKSVADILGPDMHANNIGKIHLVEFGSEGVFGWIPTEKELVQHFLTEPVKVLNTHHRDRRSTRGENKSNWALLPRIHNPIACISSGDMLFFQLAINHTDRRYSHFPVYQKDHLFNSNPSWDFGAFRQLQILMKQTSFNSTRFAHVFSETGKYVFVDSAVPEWTLVVVVTETATECNPRAAVFQPMTPAQLVKFGVVKQHKLNLLPDWGLIAGFLSVFLALVVVLTSTVLVLRPGKSKLIIAHWKNRPKWRNVGEPFCPMECNCTKDSPATPSLALVLGSREVGEGAEAEEPAITKGSVPQRCDLEDFNVKTLYDKLEDQNLHIASQLARHRKDTQEFYRNMCLQTESLCNTLEHMDNKKLLLLKEVLSHSAGEDNSNNSRVEEIDPQDEAIVVLLGAVLRSVEALICKMTIGEAWHHQYVVSQDDRESDPPHDGNNGFTQFSLGHLTKDESPITCLSDHDLSKLVSITPLFQTLQDIQQSLHNLTAAGCHLPDIGTETGESEVETGSESGELVATALESLSPQHSAIYLFGCQVMKLLCTRAVFPPVLLLLAKSVPTSFTTPRFMAHCSRQFYFDATNQILFISENLLHHTGHFISTLLQSMAYIATGSKPQMFLKVLHEAISVLSLQLFTLSLKWNAGSKEDMSEEKQGSLLSEFLNVRVPAEAHFTEHLLARRLEKYKYLKIEQLISKLKERSSGDRVKCTPGQGSPVQMSCIENEIDQLNESFIKLSMQLQNRAQVKEEAGVRSADSHARSASPSSILSLSRNGTILLELKRRYVSQRLNELQITLEHMRHGQRHDSYSQDETRRLAQTDSSSSSSSSRTQPGESKRDPGTGPHTAIDGQRGDSDPASLTHRQEAEAADKTEPKSLKYESHITEQPPDNQGSYPQTLLEAQRSTSQLQVARICACPSAELEGKEVPQKQKVRKLLHEQQFAPFLSMSQSFFYPNKVDSALVLRSAALSVVLKSFPAPQSMLTHLLTVTFTLYIVHPSHQVCVDVPSETEAVLGRSMRLTCIDCLKREEVKAKTRVDWFYRPNNTWSRIPIVKYHNDKPSVLDSPFRGRLFWNGSQDLQDLSISIQNVSFSDSGFYQCIVKREFIYAVGQIRDYFTPTASNIKNISLTVIEKASEDPTALYSEIMMYVLLVFLTLWLMVEMVYCYRKISKSDEQTQDTA